MAPEASEVSFTMSPEYYCTAAKEKLSNEMLNIRHLFECKL